MTPHQTHEVAPRDEILASLARTRATCEAIRQRGAQVHRDANLDMIGRLNAICALWVEIVTDSSTTNFAPRTSRAGPISTRRARPRMRSEWSDRERGAKASSSRGESGRYGDSAQLLERPAAGTTADQSD